MGTIYEIGVLFSLITFMDGGSIDFFLDFEFIYMMTVQHPQQHSKFLSLPVNNRSRNV